jgi:hypothetical protein
LITFNEVPPPKLTDFGTNGAGASIENDPTNATNKVLKVNKFLTPAPGSEQWAGTTISTGASDSIATIPFTATAKTMTARVYSPAVGVRVRLKVENASDDKITAETDAITTTSGAWEVLTFNFANPGTNPPVGGGPTAALDPAQTYNKLSIFMDFGLGNGGGPLPANRVYYADDISFVPAAATTAYSIPWSSFEVVQNCGTSINTVAAALAASPVSQIAFQGVGGTIALSAGGKKSGANLTIPTAPPVVYPTTLVVRGAITFE